MREPLLALSGRVADELWAARVLSRAGLLPLADPREVLATVADSRRWGQLGAPCAISARRFGDRRAIVDELGSVTFAELDRRTNCLCNAWRPGAWVLPSRCWDHRENPRFRKRDGSRNHEEFMVFSVRKRTVEQPIVNRLVDSTLGCSYC
jgi:hypothetical protein